MSRKICALAFSSRVAKWVSSGCRKVASMNFFLVALSQISRVFTWLAVVWMWNRLPWKIALYILE